MTTTITIAGFSAIGFIAVFAFIEYGEGILAGLWSLCKWLVPIASIGGGIYFAFGSLTNFPIGTLSFVAIVGLIIYISYLYKKAGYL